MSLSSRLKEARLKKGLSQEKLAQLVGVSKGSIGNYESGVSSPLEPVLIKLINVLSVDANFLYQDYFAQASEYTEDEKQLVELYRGVDWQWKEVVIDILNGHQKGVGVGEKIGRSSFRTLYGLCQ